MAKTKYASASLYASGQNPPEYCTKSGAAVNAAAVLTYWHMRGHRHVKVYVIQICKSHGQRRMMSQSIYGLQSNLFNGKPPQTKRKTAA